MYYRDHGAAHFHAIFGDSEITVEIESGRVNGTFPKRALTHVHEWRDLHRGELLEAWSLARASRPLPGPGVTTTPISSRASRTWPKSRRCHFPWLDVPDRYAAVISAFVTAVATGTI